MKINSVSFVHANNHDEDGLKDAIKKSLAMIDFSLPKNIRRIVIKPNLCYYYHPSTGETTGKAFIGSLIDVFREIAPNLEFFVVESDASAMRCDQAFKLLEYDKLAEEKQIKLLNLCKEESKEISIKITNKSLSFKIPNLFLSNNTFFVNVPKIKYMGSVKITCALKNTFGCNAVKKKSVYHSALAEAIVGLNSLIKTNLVVVDGLIVNGKFTKRLNLVMACENPVAADAAASTLLGINPQSVTQITLACKEKLGEIKFNPIGDYEYFLNSFPRKGLRDDLIYHLASTYVKLFHKA